MDRRFHRQRRRELVAEHGQHASDRRAMRIGCMHDLAHDQLSVLRIHPLVGGDLDVALDAPVVGHDVADAGFEREAPDQAVQPALEHFDDHALAAAAPVDIGHAAEHAVAMHGLAHFGRRQEQVVADAALRTQETEAFGIRDHRAGDQVQPFGRRVRALAVLQQLAVADHRAEALAEGIETVRRGEARVPAPAPRRSTGHQPRRATAGWPRGWRSDFRNDPPRGRLADRGTRASRDVAQLPKQRVHPRPRGCCGPFIALTSAASGIHGGGLLPPDSCPLAGLLVRLGAAGFAPRLGGVLPRPGPLFPGVLVIADMVHAATCRPRHFSCASHRACSVDKPRAATQHTRPAPARVAELVDALASGASGGNFVEVRVLSRAPRHAGTRLRL